jgi:hypothetical protein
MNGEESAQIILLLFLIGKIRVDWHVKDLPPEFSSTLIGYLEGRRIERNGLQVIDGSGFPIFTA